MIDHTSRYFQLESSTFTTADSRKIRYKQRRFLPQGDAMPLLAEVEVGIGDRLDTVTARHLGDPLQFWQLCDANNALNPFDLVDGTGNRVRIPLPQFQES